MRRKLELLAAALLVYIPCILAQVNPKPNPPTLDYLTNNLPNGDVTIYWTPPKHEPQIADPLGYIIYVPRNDQNPGGGDGWEPIDTVDQNTFQYTHIGANGNGQQVFYAVASLGTSEPSKLTSYHSPVWLTTQYDSCNAELKISWQGYEGWNINDTMPYQNIRYQLFMGNSANTSTFVQICDTGAFGGNRYTVKNVQENHDYYFYIKATRMDTGFVSYSNLYLIHTKMAIRPEYAYIDSIVASDNGNRIYYTIDPNTEITNFQLWRWEQPDTTQSIFSAILVEQFTVPSKSMSIDTNNTWAARTRKFYYKVDAYNGCNQAVMVSNLANTIIPRLNPKNRKVEIEWNDLYIDVIRKPNRQNDNIEYSIYRRGFTVNDDISGQGNLEQITSGLTDTKFTDDLSAFEGQSPLYIIIFKYFVEAYELNPDGDTVVLSRSREISTEILPGVTMPSAIAPNDNRSGNNHQRNIFKPVISFDASFTLTIYDRWGGVVYHGNEGWDGRNSRGEFVKEGTYIYRLVISTSNAGDIIQNGSISVVYPR